MKKLFAFIVTMTFFLMCNAQSLMTIGEVFDFAVGDKFQSYSYSQPTGGFMGTTDRITIIGKYFSVNHDTVFYGRFHEWISGYLSPDTTLYVTQTDTVYFTNLDSLISKYDTNFNNGYVVLDTILLCNSHITGWKKDDHYGDISWHYYGRGLGTVETRHIFDHIHGSYNYLFYYRKNGVECGTPNLSGVGINNLTIESQIFEIYPTPVISELFIQNKSSTDLFYCTLFNPAGQIIFTTSLNGESNHINLDKISRGIYFMQIKSGNKILMQKLVKQ